MHFGGGDSLMGSLVVKPILFSPPADNVLRKGGGSSRMIEISKREEFYQQEYCGCVYSLRDSNIHRRSQGRETIEIGKLYYSSADKDMDASG